MSVRLSKSEKEIELAVRKAGEAILSLWKRSTDLPPLRIEKKGDGSLVTEADFASNEIIISALQRAFPNDAIVSEEIPIDEQTKEQSRIWIIDPLDGTQSFVHGRDDFSVLVALTSDYLSHLGFMYFPARNQFACGRSGEGAWLDGERLHVSESKTLRPKSVYYRNFQPNSLSCCFDQTMDSGCAFLMLARGVFDGLIIKLVSHREWDLAAPAAIVQESGGRVTNERGELIRFIPGNLNCRYFVASNSIVHEEVLNLIPKEER